MIRCGKVLKKEITCLVSPCSEYHQGVTYPAEELVGVGMLRDVAVVGDFLLYVLAVFEFAIVFVAFRFRKHLIYYGGYPNYYTS